MKLSVFGATCRPSSGAQNCTSSLWFCICERLLDAEVAGRWQCQRPATSMSYNLSHMQNQRPLVQFWAPDDGRHVAPNTLSFIQTWNNEFWYTVASCWLFLYELYHDARTRKHQVQKSNTFTRGLFETTNSIKFNNNFKRWIRSSSSKCRGNKHTLQSWHNEANDLELTQTQQQAQNGHSLCGFVQKVCLDKWREQIILLFYIVWSWPLKSRQWPSGDSSLLGCDIVLLGERFGKFWRIKYFYIFHTLLLLNLSIIKK